MLGFSFKAILIKLAYAAAPVDAITLLALRMLYSAPFFVAMAWWAARGARADRARATGCALVGLGFIGYYLVEPARLHRPAVHHRVARAAGALPVSDDGRLLSALFLRKPITRRAVARARPVVRRHRARVLARPAASAATSRATLIGGALVFAQRALLRALPRRRGRRHRAARLDRASSRWAMLASTGVRARALRARRARSSALDVPPRDPRAVARDGGLLDRAADLADRRVDPPHRRERARRWSARSGPVFTIGLGAVILGEPMHAIQLAGAALVLAGVLLVTLKPARAASSARQRRSGVRLPAR